MARVCELEELFVTPELFANNGFPDFDNIASFQINYQNSGGIDTLQQLVVTGSFSGTVLEDTDGDGIGDTPIPNVEISLFADLNGDGVISGIEIDSRF